MITPKPQIWTTGDWNAFFGYGSNLLVNVLTLTGLLTLVLGMPTELVFGRVLPAVGVMLFLSSLYYSFLAYRLAQRTGRADVCALPSGPGVGHMFIVTLVVMLPITGYTLSSTFEYSDGITFFGIVIPELIPDSERVFEAADLLHAVLAYTLLAVIVMHIAGAIKHRYFDSNPNNDVLKRML